MFEKITVFNLDNTESALSVNRDEFYIDQIEVFKITGKPTKACQVVDVFLFTEEGEMILQKRSADKNHNSNSIAFFTNKVVLAQKDIDRFSSQCHGMCPDEFLNWGFDAENVPNDI